ncbi:4Fe-4S dicluster domain-containing protein [Corynebacterium halotolerans]|uniref:4Fe-4S ferredoxin n=1 Tax=Corynebacterium halotolerans YIM 70093 = DSM 44683 TaxID=1121362 RepID=M1P608_9CORY|nr:4Fe-4S dicluster domain-containing protein [Corynebacterium halotolerans]AGF72071.1 4Fe-4S ferredoxin [Corynebacterium halotolerans YIM 70093 = DSM 44683]
MTINPLIETPTHIQYGDEAQPRKGFFTDTSICIGCKACEVACKEWNQNPVDSDFKLSESSYDNTESLGADTWRHVAFVEQGKDRLEEARESGRKLVGLGMPSIGSPAEQKQDLSDVDTTPPDTPDFRWLMSSDVCKHCTHAGCLDVCPTGALFRTEHGTVVVQDDVCNGCGTCVAGCPFGVIERRSDGGVSVKEDRSQAPQEEDFIPGADDTKHNVGVAQKCTLCYDRIKDGQTPACAQACPTTSIKYGEHDELLEIAQARVAELHAQGMTEARLYGANPEDGVGGTGSIFLLLDEPEVYGLPPDPRVPTADLPQMAKKAGVAALGMLGAVAGAFLMGGRK